MHVCMKYRYNHAKRNVLRTFKKEGFDASIIKENSNIIADLMNILT